MKNNTSTQDTEMHRGILNLGLGGKPYVGLAIQDASGKDGSLDSPKIGDPQANDKDVVIWDP